MRWPLKVQAEYRNSITGSGVITRENSKSSGAKAVCRCCRSVLGIFRRFVAVDKVMFFLNGEAAFAAKAITYRANHERAGLPTFNLYGFDHGFLAHHFTQDQGFMIGRAKPAKHPSGQRNWRHESAALGMAVGADFGLPDTRFEKAPMVHESHRFTFMGRI